MSCVSECVCGNFWIVCYVFDVYGDVFWIVDEGEVFLGIVVIFLLGYIDGYIGYLFEFGDWGLFVWGDIVYFLYI